MLCLLAAPWVQLIIIITVNLYSAFVQLSVIAGNRWLRNTLRHHQLMSISCHFRDCKALLVTSLTHVSGTTTSVQTFTFNFTKLTSWSLQPRVGDNRDVLFSIARVYCDVCNSDICKMLQQATPSVCPSVTWRYRVKTKDHVVSPPGRSGTPVVDTNFDTIDKPLRGLQTKLD